MELIRLELDPMWKPVIPGPTAFKTLRNEYEVDCEMCGNPNYVDRRTFKNLHSPIEMGTGNPFFCVTCGNRFRDSTS